MEGCKWDTSLQNRDWKIIWDYGLSLTCIQRQLVELKRQWEMEGATFSLIRRLFPWILLFIDGPRQKNKDLIPKISEDRDIGTVRVKCSSLFQRWCVAGLGQLCHCHLMLLVGKVMGVALMCRWGLWAAACPAVSPWFAPRGTQDKEGSQPVRGYIAKGRDTAQWGGVSQAQAFGGGLWLSLLCVQVFHGYMLEKIGYFWVATWFGVMTMPFKT